MTAPLHVLHVLGNAIAGGMEHWVLRLAQALPAAECRFSALCPFESPITDALRAAGVETWIAPVHPDPAWTSVQAAAEMARHRGADLLHAHMPHAHLLAGMAGLVAGRPVLTTIHARQLCTLDLEVHRAFHTHVSVVCRQTFCQALGLGVDPARLSCDPNGVDTGAFAPRPRSGRLRRALGLADEVPLAGCVGRLSPEKGPEVLVRAAQLAQRRAPALHFVFVGDGPMAGELRALAQALGVADRVHFAGPQADMPDVYADLDLQVCCSHTEAMPLAVLEGMASGLPVVATRVGGVPELVAHGASGLLVAPGDFDALATACATLAGTAALRRRLGRHGRERAERGFPLDAAAARMARLYRSLAAPRATRLALHHSA